MRIFPTNRPLILVTMGDPSGIAPEVIAKAILSPEISGLSVFTVIGDAPIMEKAFKAAGFRGDLAKVVNIIDPSSPLRGIRPGKPSDDGARKAVACLDLAINIMSQKASRAALVTAPVNKERISRIMPGFVGHTEYLKDAFSVRHVTMVLTGKRFSVAPVTRHIPLKNVAKKLNGKLIRDTIEQVIAGREIISGKNNARIAVLALNPHCGEGGRIGREEIEIIAPQVKMARKKYKNIVGPISADVAFYKALKGDFDVIVAMYHDQGLAPFKMVEFENGVNITLGLGAVRTSPDHGTAYDIAGRGIANPSSMIQAIKLAIRAIN